jgi:hypothetical protein
MGAPYDDRVASAVAALAPYRWREQTASMVARRVLAALDRYDVGQLLAAVPDAEEGAHGLLEPVPPRDERVDVLVELLEGRQWRAATLPALCRDLTAAHDAWVRDRAVLEAGLRELLSDP